MKTLFAIIVSLIGVVAATAADKKAEPPKYPGQPSINAALKNLTTAQEKIATEQAVALEHLKKAQTSLEAAIKDKGSFRATAIRLTKQAIKHLEKGEAETATHEIAEAIENADRAGQQGAR